MLYDILQSADALDESSRIDAVPEPSKLGTSLAATGSVTAENTSGMLLVEAATDCADGVAIATITSGSSATRGAGQLPAGLALSAKWIR